MKNIKKLRLILFLALIVPCFFIPSVSLADTLGDQKTFNTNTQYDRFARTSITATLRTISDNAYFYVEDKYWSGLSFYEQSRMTQNLKDFANEFETVIYPKEKQLWGSEPNPGIDNDPKITILIEDLAKNFGGYFETINLASKASSEVSNEREMFAVGAGALGSDLLKDFLAHEFQHLISFNQKEIINRTTEDVWLNELRSEYSVTWLGYNSNLPRRIQAFIDSPSDSLTEWPNTILDYALVSVFGEYLADRFSPSILSETLHSPGYGIPSLNQYLYERGTGFNDVFMDWMAAVYLNDQSVGLNYGFSQPEFRSIKIYPQSWATISDVYGYNGGPALKDWQPYWMEYSLQNVSDTKSLKLNLDGFGQSFLASYIAYYGDGTIEVKKIPVSGSRATGFAMNSPGKRLNKVVLMLTKAQKLADFSKEESASTISVNAEMIDNSAIEGMTLKDGALIKRPREKEIYVIWGKYKRYLNPDVIKLYGHLDPSKAIEVEPEIFNSYTTSNYVRDVNDKKVYAVWPDGTKHWMNITPQQWDATGRDWNAVFIINDLELNFYRTGGNITR